MRKRLSLSFDADLIGEMLKRRKAPLPETGSRYGKLVVTGKLGFVTSGWSRLMISCRCDCGSETYPYVQTLTSGKAVSCGCAPRGKAERQGQPKIDRPVYSIWSNMRRRCEVPSIPTYQWYGARGIKVCDEWRNSYWAFDDWAMANGWAPGLSIDRIDVNGNYEPSNCRWANSAEQARNRRNNVIVEAFGEKRVLIDWVNDPRCLVDYNIVSRRLAMGYPPEAALTEPAFAGTKYEAFGEAKVIAEWALDPRCVVSENALRERLRPHKGMSVEEALTKPAGSKPVAGREIARAKRRAKEARKRQQRLATQSWSGGPPNSAI